MKELNKIVILGAGQAGAQFAMSLRQEGFVGDITLIGDEVHLPYERPQLSKEVLLNSTDEVRWIKSIEEYKSLNIDLVLGASVKTVNAEKNELILEDGTIFSFDVLVLAMGVSARQLFKDQPDHFISLRNVQDALNMKSKLVAGSQVLIIGGGVIGLEVASAAIEKGSEVTVVEATSQLMGRVLDDTSSQLLQNFHVSKGVNFLFNTSVESVNADGTIKLSNGQIVHPDLVVLGVGVTPNNQCVEHLNITDSLGIVVNEYSQTAIPNIYAIGDIAVQTDSNGQKFRVETWQNALDQSTRLATYLVKKHHVDPKANWFSSDQSNLNLQVIGSVKGKNRIERILSENKLTYFYLDDESHLIGCLTLNNPKDMVFARRYISSNQKFDPKKLADSQLVLKESLRG